MTAKIHPARPHGPLREVFDNVFVVRGTLAIGPVAATRNMTVLRQGTELTVLNSVRLSDEGERALAKLGTVKHLVRLGFFHGMDDPYFMQRYAPTFWSGARVVPVNIDAAHVQTLTDAQEAPFGFVHHFANGAFDETACVIASASGRVLVTCDSLQNNVDTEGANFLGGLMFRAFGLYGGVRVGPPWLKRMTGGKREALRADFERLLALDFAHLVSGHGAPRVDAKPHVIDAVRAVFPR